MHFELSEELKMFQKAMRGFAEKEIAPLVKQAEEQEETPMALYQKMGDQGYLCPAYPPEVGGGGVGKIGECIMIEEVARICSGIASGIMTQSGLATRIVYNHGTEEQKKKHLIPAIMGKKLAAFGLTEPNAGSDAAAIETTAVKKGDQYIINGSKIYITNGQNCDYVLVAAITDKSQGPKGVSVFLVEGNTPGFTKTKMKKLGNHSSVTSQLFFDSCIVPSANLIGEEGKGFRYVVEALNSARISHSARSIGTAQAAYEAALQYAKDRVQFGQPIGKFQAVSFKLAEMATQIEAARALLYKVAALYESGDQCRKEGPMTKLFSAEVAIHTAELAMRIFAGAGYLAESVAQRFYRDAILYYSTEGTNDIQKTIISREIGL